jgi:creatinine amidohydrolase
MILTWHNTSWEIKANPPEMALLPLACYEPHGPHLPIGTDLIIVNEIALRVAEKMTFPVFLLPIWPLGTSIHHSGKPGVLSISYETLWAVVRDLVTSLHAHGIQRVVVINNHGSAASTTTKPMGNFIVKTAVRQLNYETPTLTAIWVQPFSAARQKLASLFPSANKEVHAGAVETAILLHLAPDLVGTPPPDYIPSVSPDYLDIAPLSKLAPDGVWGYPSEATSEKGKLALNAIIEATSHYIKKTFEQLNEIKQ